jgi:hypothetical protein
MLRYELPDFLKKRLTQTRLPSWLSRQVGPADDPMGMVAVGTILIAIGWLSFRFWRRLRRRGRRS